MKQFFDRYLFNSVKMLVTQIVIAIFGLVLAVTCADDKRLILRIFGSVFAVLFYMFLLYYDSWNIGYKDRSLQKKNPFTGLLMSLVANSINILLAIFFLLGTLNPASNFCAGIGAFGSFVALLGEGMYTGLLTLTVDGTPLNKMWYSYFLIILPALLATSAGYLAGLHEFMMTGLMKTDYPESDRPETGRGKRH